MDWTIIVRNIIQIQYNNIRSYDPDIDFGCVCIMTLILHQVIAQPWVMDNKCFNCSVKTGAVFYPYINRVYPGLLEGGGGVCVWIFMILGVKGKQLFAIHYVKKSMLVTLTFGLLASKSIGHIHERPWLMGSQCCFMIIGVQVWLVGWLVVV